MVPNRETIRSLTDEEAGAVGDGATETLFRIVDPDTLRADVLLPETLLTRLIVGRGVKLEPRATGVAAWGAVIQVGPSIDLLTGKVRVVIPVDSRDGKCPAGGAAKVGLQGAIAPGKGRRAFREGDKSCRDGEGR